MQKQECLKIPYDSPQQAGEAMRRISKKKGRLVKNVYRCDKCGKYHLTKMRVK